MSNNQKWITAAKDALEQIEKDFRSAEEALEALVSLDVLACSFVHLELKNPEEVIESWTPSLSQILEMLPRSRAVSRRSIQFADNLEEELGKIEYKLNVDEDASINLRPVNEFRQEVYLVCRELLQRHLVSVRGE